MVYDLIVLGGGPAGYLGAQRAGFEGLKTLLIEKASLGGVCLNEGCIPTKTLLNSAKIYDNARFGEKYGVITKDIFLDHKSVLKRKNQVVKFLVAGVKSQLKHSNVTIVEGFGKIVGKKNEGYIVKTDEDTFVGKRLMIATGSEPIIPGIPGVHEGLKSGTIFTNREILDINQVPSSIIIIGGGIVGLEMASYFNSAGSKVTVIEMLDHIAGNTDREISQILMKNYSQKGIDFKLNSKVTEINGNTVLYESEGKRSSLEGEKMLMSIGRKPSIAGIGLESIGVEVIKGSVKTDETGQTNVPGVYAAGDVNGYSMLAHTAYREAEVCVNNMLGKRDIMRYHAIPSVIYTNPEVACVGETQESAAEKGIDFHVSKVSMSYSGRYVAENDGANGICKVLIDKKHEKIIGVHMIGNFSSEIIYGAGLMIESEMRVKDINELVFPHPTVSEIIREALFNF
ncbi:MAG TPA: dihydrolipoyl dehydrogenase [Thermoanaerobacterales bacterium]|nr:dihydrolipoyl dehydrogenase [Thermoanaerobacterales bacterium]